MFFHGYGPDVAYYHWKVDFISSHMAVPYQEHYWSHPAASPVESGMPHHVHGGGLYFNAVYSLVKIKRGLIIGYSNFAKLQCALSHNRNSTHQQWYPHAPNTEYVQRIYPMLPRCILMRQQHPLLLENLKSHTTRWNEHRTGHVLQTRLADEC